MDHQLPWLSTNPNVWITYGWYIDDVKLVTNPDHDLEITDTFGELKVILL